MEGVGASFEGDQWGCIGGSMYTTTTEEADFMAELLGTFSSFPNDQLGSYVNPSPLVWAAAAHESIINSSSDVSNHNILFPGSYNYLTDSQHVLAGDSNNSVLSMDFGFCVSVHDHHHLHEKEKNFSSKHDQYGLNANSARDGDCPGSLLLDMPTVLLPSPPALKDDQHKKKKKKKMPENPKKRTRDSGVDHVEKNKIMDVRKKKKRNQRSSSSSSSSDHIEEKENIHVVNGQQQQQQSSSSCCSEEKEEEEESSSINASGQHMTNNGESTLKLNGKTRAGRGSATDPQSLYARKRRERINERLRILQNLVPNGTKVDISTMLEEAVQYVKFLQLQIKLLSSDDLWMYAPLAYNGMDIGLDLKIAMPRK